MRRRGFTLMELSTVVAVLAIVAAMVVPNVVRMRQGQDERLAPTKLRDLFSFCASEAVRRGQTVVVRFDDPTNTFTATIDQRQETQTTDQQQPVQATGRAATPTDTVRSFALPGGVTAAAFRLGKEDPQGSQWEPRFYADRSADPCAVQLSEGGKPSTIVVDDKGRAEIQDGAMPDQKDLDWQAGDYERRQ
ncbi:MAG: prepilin-type N-terminal cleavage/methylation domain-containing protein [Armatimonadetes bacterium]|nr:prepilin-type N-terminal cleavage/methylation domain-containing protein [Armatimonadota bacterium]